MDNREMDARVHRALWPDDEVTLFVSEQDKVWGSSVARWHYERDGCIADVPHYTPDLMAWDGVLPECRWVVDERAYHVFVTLMIPHIVEPTTVIEAKAAYGDHNGNRFEAQAMARSLCVLQWAERSEEQ